MFKTFDGIVYEMTPFDEWVVSHPVDKNITMVSIPAYLENCPVAIIKGRAFAGCKNLKIVELGDNVNKIGESAFLGCCYLEHVCSSTHQKEGIQIGFRAFENCRSLTRFDAKISFIEENAFRNCVNLEECNISAECKEIKNYAFTDCISLEKVFIESNPIDEICIAEDAFFCTRIFEFHCQRNVNLIRNNYLNSKTIEDFLPDPTVIYCSSWSNLVDLTYLGRKIIIEEKSLVVSR